jgi:hypothetical protein
VFEFLHLAIRSRTVETRVVRRAMVLWLLVRLMAAVAAAFANQGGMAIRNPVDLTIEASVIVVLAVIALSAIDARRQNIDLFLANLGTSRMATVLLPLAAASCMEIAIHILSVF